MNGLKILAAAAAGERHITADPAEKAAEESLLLPHGFCLVFVDGNLFAVFLAHAVNINDVVLFVEFNSQNVAADLFRFQKGNPLNVGGHVNPGVFVKGNNGRRAAENGFDLIF